MRGFVNINKPLNMTSSDVVVKVRGILRKATGEKQKVGHLGTLDPLGTGVLPVAVGKATRLFDYCMVKQKVYDATFVFGQTTDTLDRAGKLIESDKYVPTKGEIENILPSFIGDIEQMPPQYSAKSINGKRAYEYAREGVQVELKPKKIHIDNIQIIKEIENGFAFRVTCGGGTYIRSLARDIANKLNTVGYMTSINRLKSSNFELANSVTIDEFEKNPLQYILPIEIALNGFDKFELPDKDKEKILNGIKFNYDNLPNTPFYVTSDNEIVAMAKNDGGRLILTTRL